MATLQEIFSQFVTDPCVGSYGNGHINDTYLCEEAPRYILQKINTGVFPHPDAVMENIVKVTRHLAEQIRLRGGDPGREALTVIPTKEGHSFYQDGEGNCYRMYLFIEGSRSVDVATDPGELYEAAKAFGAFQKALKGFPAGELHETIPNFHNTPWRVEQLKKAIAENAAGRLDAVEKEVAFALEYSKYAPLITEEMAKGTVPLRVTHNDTKLNNVLFEKDSPRALCVIDLDTVMPGSALYDFGDALRFGAASGKEDETDLTKIWFDLEKFEAFTKGFLEAVGEDLTPMEIALLPEAVLLLTYECGIRFLTDYLNGDTYFKIHREHHNLDRARTQFRLVRDIEEKLPQMHRIVKAYC